MVAAHQVDELLAALCFLAKGENFRQALQVRGVDLMSRTSGVLSGVHTEADIDQSLEAFDGAIKAMVDEGLVSYS